MPGADHLPAPDDRDAEGDLGDRIFAPRLRIGGSAPNPFLT